MSDQQNETNTDNGIPGPGDLTAAMAKIAERSQVLVNNFMANQSDSFGMADPMNVGSAFIELTQQMMSNPAQMMQAQVQLWHSGSAAQSEQHAAGSGSVVGVPGRLAPPPMLLWL